MVRTAQVHVFCSTRLSLHYACSYDTAYAREVIHYKLSKNDGLYKYMFSAGLVGIVFMMMLMYPAIIDLGVLSLYIAYKRESARI